MIFRKLNTLQHRKAAGTVHRVITYRYQVPGQVLHTCCTLNCRRASALPCVSQPSCLKTSYCCTSTAIEWPWTRKHPRGCRGDGPSHQTRCRSRFLAFCRACRLVTVVFARVSPLARFSNIGHRVSSLFYTSRPVSAVSKRSVLLLAVSYTHLTLPTIYSV